MPRPFVRDVPVRKRHDVFLRQDLSEIADHLPPERIRIPHYRKGGVKTVGS
jgi:hypothetical protein